MTSEELRRVAEAETVVMASDPQAIIALLDRLAAAEVVVKAVEKFPPIGRTLAEALHAWREVGK